MNANALGGGAALVYDRSVRRAWLSGTLPGAMRAFRLAIGQIVELGLSTPPTGSKLRREGYAWLSERRGDFLLFAVLAVLGIAAARFNVRIPHTPLYIEGRWAFGYMGFALLGRWWLALILAGVLSLASPDPLVSIWIVLGGNMLYAVPGLVVLRLAYRRLLVHLNMVLCGLGWTALVLFCYQAFNTPLTLGLVASIGGESFVGGALAGWWNQPYLLESILVAVVSALGVLLCRSHYTLAESRRELSITLDSIGDGVIATDVAGRVLRLNPVAERLTGYAQDEARGRPVEEVFRIVSSLSDEPVPSPITRVIEEGVVVGLANHTSLIARDGQRRQIADSAAPIRDVDGGLIGVVMVFRDVTKEYAARDALRESNRRYREIFAGSRDGFVMVDTAGHILDANPAYCQMLGYDLAGLRELESFYSITPEKWRQWEREEIWDKQLLRRGYSDVYEKEYIRSDGTVFPVELRSYAVRDEQGELIYLWGVARDVSARQAARQALAESEHRFRSFVENASDIVYELAPDGTFTYISPNWLDFMGEPAEDAIGKSFREYVHPEDVRLCEGFLQEVLASGQRRDSVEYRVYRADGVLGWHVSTGSPLRNEDGQVSRYVGIARDVTAKKQAEQALRESERRYRSLAENFPNGALFLMDRDFRYLVANGRAFPQVGLSAEAIEGRTVAEVFPDLWPDMRAFHEAIFRGEHVRYETEFQGRLYSNQGVPIFDENGLVAQAIVITQDITDVRQADRQRQQLEAQLRQSQKLEAVGRLAGGVAHDFNNMLHTILGFTDLLLADTDEQASSRESLEQIHSAAQRSADLTRQLLAFARKQTIAPEVLDLNETVAGMLKMLRRLIGEDIELIWKPAANLPAVEMDPAQLDQVLANLVVNSRDAIAGVGQIVIETSAIEVDEAYCLEHAECQVGPHVRLSVSDTGAGMDARTLEQVFEPFYTTKPKDQGTGLGLATVYGIVHQNGGFINAYSEPGKGATFHIALPAARRAKPATVQDPNPPVLPTGRETILVAEDDAGILRLADRALSELGYEVLAAAGPKDALQLAEETPEAIDLLVTDVIMPGMSGQDLHGLLRARQPGLRCLYMSGYTAEVIAHRGVLEEGVNFLQKPFSAAELARKVREVLDAPKPSDAPMPNAEAGEPRRGETK